MKSVDENGQLLFVDTFDRTSNALVIGKVGKGAAFHLRKTFFDSLNIKWRLSKLLVLPMMCRQQQLAQLLTRQMSKKLSIILLS